MSYIVTLEKIIEKCPLDNTRTKTIVFTVVIKTIRVKV